jgi:S1-C subfamily serine protease
VPFTEHDVSVDHAAAQEMVRRSGQMGVPVITVGNEVIVGFDRPRLERILAQGAGAPAGAGGPKLGLLVRNGPAGVEVGSARPGLLGDKSGVRPGDVVEAIAGHPVHTVADLERLAAGLPRNQRIELVVRRNGQQEQLSVIT